MVDPAIKEWYYFAEKSSSFRCVYLCRKPIEEATFLPQAGNAFALYFALWLSDSHFTLGVAHSATQATFGGVAIGLLTGIQVSAKKNTADKENGLLY